MSEQQQIVKRKNIGEETLRESRIETENEKVERLSETIFMLMLELEGTRSRLKKWERKGLEQTELIDGSIPPNEKNQIETLMSENAALRVQLDKMANLEIENAYFKENYTKLEELYTHEQRKSRRLEERMEEYGSNDISRMEQVFEGKMQFTRVEETSHRVEHTETTERTEIVERTDRVGTFYVQPETLDIKGGSEGSEGELQDISLLSKNIQRKVRKEPGQYNINANQLEREVYILSQEVDRLNQENQKLIEQNFILVRRQRQAGLEEPEFVSEHFHSGGGLSPRAKSGNPGSPDEKDRLDPFNNEMRPHDISADMRMADLVSQPSEILVPGKEGGGFPALLSNDGTLMLREKIKKLEEEIDDYAGTIRRLEKSNRELEKRNEEVEKENVKLRQSAQTAMRLSNRPSENKTIEHTLIIEKIEKEREYFRSLVTEKQREVVILKEIMRDNGIDPSGKKQSGYADPQSKMGAPTPMVEDIEMDNPSFRGGSGNPLINVNARQATPGGNRLPSDHFGELGNAPSFKEVKNSRPDNGENQRLRNRVRDLENELLHVESNFGLEKQELLEKIERGEKDIHLLLKRNSGLEEANDRLKDTLKRLKENVKKPVKVGAAESEVEEELKKEMKNSVIQQNIEKMKNISASLLNQKEEEYQKEMRKLKLTLDNINKANLTEDNKDLLRSLRRKKASPSPSPKVNAQPGPSTAELEKLKKENQIMEEALAEYKEDVGNMMKLMERIEAQVENLEAENEELRDELNNLGNDLDRERESYKDLKDQYLDQIELNNQRNKEITLLKNQLGRERGIGVSAGPVDSAEVERLRNEVVDKNEVIRMLREDSRDKENQKIHLSSKIRDLEVLFRDLEKENHELRKLKEVKEKNGGEGGSELHVQIIRQQQAELKRWRESGLEPEEVGRLKGIIKDQYMELVKLRNGEQNNGGDQKELMAVVRKQQEEIEELKKGSPPASPEDAAKIQDLQNQVQAQKQEIEALRANPSAESHTENQKKLMDIIRQKQNEINELKRQIPTAKNQQNIEKLLNANGEQKAEIANLRRLLQEAERGNQAAANNDQLRKLIQKQQEEIENLKRQVRGPQETANSKELVKIIKEQQEEINKLRLENAGSAKSEELIRMLKEKQDEINHLNMRSHDIEDLKAQIGKKNEEINALKRQVGSGQTVDKLMELLNQKQAEINQMRLNRGSQGQSETALQQQLASKSQQIADLQHQVNQLRKGSSQQTEDLIKMVQDKQDEINQLRAEKSNASGQSAEQTRKEIELRNEISRLKSFEEKSMNLENKVRSLEEQLRMLGNENPELADRRKLAEIIQNQQNKINQMMEEMGGKDLVGEVKKKEARLKVLEPENERLRRTMKEIQQVNNTNKTIYLKEKETLTREINRLRHEIQVIHEKEVIERGGSSERERELEMEVRELAEMVNRISAQAGAEDPYLRSKYEEEKAKAQIFEEKAEDYDNLKTLYENKLRENEAKIITQNRLEMKLFVLVSELRMLRDIVKNKQPGFYEVRKASRENSTASGSAFKRSVQVGVQSQAQGPPKLYGNVGRRRVTPGIPMRGSVQTRSRSPGGSYYRNSNPLNNRVNKGAFRTQQSDNMRNTQYQNQTYNQQTGRQGNTVYSNTSSTKGSITRTIDTRNTMYTNTTTQETLTRTRQLSYSPSPSRGPGQATAQNKVMPRNRRTPQKVDIFSSGTQNNKKRLQNQPDSSFAQLRNNRRA